MKAALLALLLAGCALTPPADPSKMTPEQINAMAKDRGASASCTTANSPWGVGRTIMVQLDRSVIVDGSITVDAECKVSISNAPKAR